jgi:hypothetical protein
MMRALLVLSILVACGGTTKGTTPGLSKDDAVLEAVFLHEIAQAAVSDDETICLTTRGSTNDGTALLAAIKARHGNAVLDAECSGGGPSGPVVNSAGGKAVRFDIGPVTWIDDDNATCDGGGGHRGGATAHEVKYSLKREGGGWKVTGEKPGLTI